MTELAKLCGWAGQPARGVLFPCFQSTTERPIPDNGQRTHAVDEVQSGHPTLAWVVLQVNAAVMATVNGGKGLLLPLLARSAFGYSHAAIGAPPVRSVSFQLEPFLSS